MATDEPTTDATSNENPSGAEPDCPKQPSAPPADASATDEPRPHHSDIHLTPGGSVAEGRFRLLIFHGGPQHLQFWQAVDTVLGHQVALTLVDPDGVLPAGDIDHILWLTAQLRGIDTPGIARVLGVGRSVRGGLVIAQWIRGATLREVADTAPSPVRVADAVEPLVVAAEAAHRGGIALSIDHPSRLRVSAEGDVVLAFPATMPDATPQDDLRGIGGAMYALLVKRWPLQDRELPSGWAHTERDPQGQPAEPATLNPEIPFLISAVATGLVRERGGIHNNSTVLGLLQQATAEALAAEPRSFVREPPRLPPPGGYAGFGNFGPAERAEAARRQTLRAYFAVAAAVMVVAALMLASTLNSMTGGGTASRALNTDKLGLNAESSKSPQPPQPPPSTTVGGPVKPVKAAVFSPGGAPDSPESAGLAVDGDPSTAWSTDTYFDAVPFPKFKEGVGVLLQLPQPTALSAVTVDLSSTGTVVQVRSATSATPVRLADTAELAPPMPVRPGHNSIPVNHPEPVANVLVWIATLGTTQGKSHSDVSEITLQATSPRA